MFKYLRSLGAALTLLVVTAATAPAQFTTPEASLLQGLTTAGDSWSTQPIFTVGETISGYTPPGIFDGIGALPLNGVVRFFVNHELGSSAGYPYLLANGTELTGARISYFDVDPITRELLASGPAYGTIINRAGDVVDEASDLEFGGGFQRFCSSALFRAGEYSLVDDIYFTGEETGGGTEYALDPASATLYAMPWLGRAAWENVTLLDTGDANTIAVLVGDDRGGAPLTLYVGQKNAVGDGSFLDRNGLAGGSLYVWVADNGDSTPEEWNGTGSERTGTFVEIDYYRPDLAGNGDYDALGFATQEYQGALALAAGAFQFSRPEDIGTDPADETIAVLASTGIASLFPSDAWGTTYRIDLDFGATITADLKILYDGDDAGNGQFAGPDFGLRSPDNLDWSDDGFIYIQEDRSVDGFGQTSGEEASVWRLDPVSGVLTRIAQVDRSAVPSGQTDPVPGDIGNWETSGILDVTALFETQPGETLFILDVQAHSLRDGVIASENLVEGGQLLFLSNAVPIASDDTAPECGQIRVERNGPGGNLSAVLTSARDMESGIESVKFTTLRNLEGYVDGVGPFEQGTFYFPFEPTSEVSIRAERISYGQGGAVLVEVTNGAGLSRFCDPIVDQLDAAVPEAFALEAAYPNPFRAESGSVQVPFRVAEASTVRMTVYDAVGHAVIDLVDEDMAAGSYKVTWDGTDAAGRSLSAGVYIVRMAAGSYQETQRILLVK